jgi:hypothetical protein
MTETAPPDDDAPRDRPTPLAGHAPPGDEPLPLGAPDPGAPEPAPLLRGPRLQLLVLVLGLAGSAIGYRVIEGQRLEQSALLFIGLPALLAMVLILATEARSSAGIVFKGTTLALLMSMILLGEGAVCVLMAAPIIYVTVGVVWGLATWISSSFGKGKNVQCVAALPLLLVSLEGTTPALSFSRAETVETHRVLPVSEEDVERRVSRPPRFDTALPAFLQLGFPRPQWVESTGIEVGDRWTVHFAGGEGSPGDLVLRVVKRSPREIRFAAVGDDSKIAHWLTWREAIVRWEPTGEGATRISLRLEYDRELDPFWYFGPLERYAVGLAASYLIDNLVVSDR